MANSIFGGTGSATRFRAADLFLRSKTWTASLFAFRLAVRCDMPISYRAIHHNKPYIDVWLMNVHEIFIGPYNRGDL
jgi:hypothetical protein